MCIRDRIIRTGVSNDLRCATPKCVVHQGGNKFLRQTLPAPSFSDGIANLYGARLIWRAQIAAAANQGGWFVLCGLSDRIPTIPTHCVRSTFRQLLDEELHGIAVIFAGWPVLRDRHPKQVRERRHVGHLQAQQGLRRGHQHEPRSENCLQSHSSMISERKRPEAFPAGMANDIRGVSSAKREVIPFLPICRQLGNSSTSTFSGTL